MYAIVKTGGKQYRVERGQHLLVERLAADEGSSVTLQPLLYRSEETVFDAAGLAKVTVTAKVIGHERGEKLRVAKFKPKRGYKRRNGHRQELTRIEVTELALQGGSPAKGEAPAKAPKPAAEPAKAKAGAKAAPTATAAADAKAAPAKAKDAAKAKQPATAKEPKEAKASAKAGATGKAEAAKAADADKPVAKARTATKAKDGTKATVKKPAKPKAGKEDGDDGA
jgi:large subunit ribosomal protein L21